MWAVRPNASYLGDSQRTGKDMLGAIGGKTDAIVMIKKD
jgi:hypothetical protein